MDWSGVRERVLAVASAKRTARGWRPAEVPDLYPVLTAEEVAEAEAQFGVTFPQEYRSFLLEVGAGGVGPKILLAELRKVRGSWGWITEDDEGCVFELDASGPFIESDDWLGVQIGTLRAAGFEPTVPDPDEDYFLDYQAAFGESAGEDLWYEQQFRGVIRISDNGCGMTGWLIVVGPHRGEVRDRAAEFNARLEPYVDAFGERHTFGSWYLDWLEQEEKELAEYLAAQRRRLSGPGRNV